MSPEELYRLHEFGVCPDIVYFDSTKVLDDLPVAEQLFPEAILCGDDWSWGAEEGFPVQRAVHAFCDAHDYSVVAESATWYLTRDRD